MPRGRARVEEGPHRPRQIGTKWVVIDGKRYKVKVYEAAAARGAYDSHQSVRSVGKYHPTLSVLDHDSELWGRHN